MKNYTPKKIGYIPQVKKTKIFNNLLIFDTESLLHDEIVTDEEKENARTERTYHECYLICSDLVIRNNKRDIIKEETQDFYYEDYHNPSLDFWDYIYNLNEEYTELYVCSHNAKYDTLIINTLEELSNSDYSIEDLSFSNPFFIKATKKDEEKTLFFFSTTNIFQTSIKKLGDEIGKPKLDFDYYDKKPPLKKAVRYCRRDVEIIRDTLINYFELLKDEGIKQEKITIAGQSFSIFRQKYMQKKSLKFCHIDRVNALERDAYHGGRTEVFRRGTYIDIIDIDKNSMYPNVMLKNKYPVEKMIEREFLTERQLRELMNDFYVISNVYLTNVDLPIFGKIINGKLCFPTGNFFVSLHKAELEIAIAMGYIDYIGYTIAYKEEYIFVDYIKEFYAKRQGAKKQGSLYALFYKYFLNSLYGKFGQQNIKMTKGAEVKDKKQIGEFYEVEKKADGTYTHSKIMIFNGYQWRSERDGESVFSMPAIAGAVTAYGRIEMFHALKIAGFKNNYYMDTDSIFTNQKGYDNIKKAGLISETELGLFKIEEFCKKITINNVKDYEFTTDEKTVRKLKGINLKEAKQIDNNKYIIDYWSGYSNLIHNKDNRYYTEKRIKEYKSEYTKGITESDGTIKPFELNEDFKKYLNDFKGVEKNGNKKVTDKELQCMRK